MDLTELPRGLLTIAGNASQPSPPHPWLLMGDAKANQVTTTDARIQISAP